MTPAVVAEGAAAVASPFEVVSSPTAASTATARIIASSLFHLLAKRTRPSVVGLAIQDISRDLIPDDPLTQLVDIKIAVVPDKFLCAVDLIHILQETLQSLHECFIGGASQEL